MGKKIVDKYTDDPTLHNRQRRKQLRWREEGRCEGCGGTPLAVSKLGTRTLKHCHECVIKSNYRNQQRREHKWKE